MYIQGSPVEIQTPNTLALDQAQYDRSTACYRPAVFFHLLRLIVLSFPQGEIRRAFKKYYY
jgi:hypothetical protein